MNSAISAYYSVSESSMEGRRLEAHLLKKSARLLSGLSSNDYDSYAFEEALFYNRRLWTAIVSLIGSANNEMDEVVKANILSLAAFVFKQTNIAASSGETEDLASLIDINLSLASGLSS